MRLSQVYLACTETRQIHNNEQKKAGYSTNSQQQSYQTGPLQLCWVSNRLKKACIYIEHACIATDQSNCIVCSSMQLHIATWSQTYIHGAICIYKCRTQQLGINFNTPCPYIHVSALCMLYVTNCTGLCHTSHPSRFRDTFSTHIG